MKSSSFILLLLFITCSINSIISDSSSTTSKCGKVYDGLTNGMFDMSTQTSTSTIAANWVNFGDNVLFYEWSIISDSYRIPISSVNSEGCFEDLRINRPDVMHWEVLNKQSSSAIKTNLTLKEGGKYYVLLRATYRSGQQLIAISDGVLIIPSEEEIIQEETHHNVELRGVTMDATVHNSHNRHKRDLIRTSTSTATTSENCLADPFYVGCPIENENRCRQNYNKRVSDYLNQIYGKALFPTIDEQPVIVKLGPSPPEDDGADDDDSQSPAWILAPIIGFIFGLFLLALCLVCLVFICCNCGRRNEQEEGGDIGPIGDDDDRKDYGNRGGVNKADTTTQTKVEFPDTNIRRLSVDHNDEEEVNEEVKGTRRKHPIASSSSSSFRDYRAVNQ